MEDTFFLPNDFYENDSPRDDVTSVTLLYDNMIFDYHDPDTGEVFPTIPLKYEYRLFKDDVNFFLSEYAKDRGVTVSGDLLNVLTDDLIDENRLYTTIENLLDNSKYHNLMLDHCRKRAENEFFAAFTYWVDRDSVDEYLQKDTFE